MPLAADEGLALFANLNAIPEKSWLAGYSCQTARPMTLRLNAAWHGQLGKAINPGDSFNLDFHSVPFSSQDPQIEKHYVSMRSRSQPSVPVFLVHDAGGQAFCYSNADIRKGEERDEIFRFISFWQELRGGLPRELVFDSQLTTLDNLTKLDGMGIRFITLRRRSPRILKEIEDLPASAWRRITLDVPTRQHRTPSVFEQTVQLAGRPFRQIYAKDLGHDAPTVFLTNHRQSV